MARSADIDRFCALPIIVWESQPYASARSSWTATPLQWSDLPALAQAPAHSVFAMTSDGLMQPMTALMPPLWWR